MEKRKNFRNGVIELLRFLFALMIVLHHGRYLGGGDKHALYANFGYIGVEFFFIVTGFLMAQSASRIADPTDMSLGRETGHFLWRKMKAILPFYALAVVASLVSDQLLEPRGTSEWMTGIWDISFLGVSGIKTIPVVNASWYLSAMFLSIVILYPLIRRFKDKFTYIIAPLIAVVFLGYLSKTYGNLNQYTNEFDFIYTGWMRALADMSIGCIAYEVVRRIKDANLSTLSRILVSILSTGIFLVIIIQTHRAKAAGFDFVLLLLIAVLTTLVFSNLGKIGRAKIFHNPIFPWLGKFSLVLYLNHMWVKTVINHVLPESMGYSKLMIIFVVCSILVSMAMMAIAYGLKKFWTRYGAKIKACFVKVPA